MWMIKILIFVDKVYKLVSGIYVDGYYYTWATNNIKLYGTWIG